MLIRPVLFAGGQASQNQPNKKNKPTKTKVNTPPPQPAVPQPDSGFPIKKPEGDTLEKPAEPTPADAEPSDGLPINKKDEKKEPEKCPLPLNKKGKKPNKKNLPDIDPDKDYSVC